MSKEPYEYKYLSYAQKQILRELDKSQVKYKIAQYHGDGSITIRTDDTHLFPTARLFPKTAVKLLKC